MRRGLSWQPFRGRPLLAASSPGGHQEATKKPPRSGGPSATIALALAAASYFKNASAIASRTAIPAIHVANLAHHRVSNWSFAAIRWSGVLRQATASSPTQSFPVRKKHSIRFGVSGGGATAGAPSLKPLQAPM
jgi:hypothetical protein